MPGQVAPLELEECDPLGIVPCEHQATLLQIPIAGTGVALTYTSEFVAGRTDRPQSWDASSVGLGGWSLDVLQRYDATNGVLLSGDGSWRLTDSLALPDGDTAVPSFDGRLAYVFDPAGRHVRTVDAILGVDLISLTYDELGRLLTVEGSLDSAPIDLTVQRTPDGNATGLIGAGGAATKLIGADHLAGVVHPYGGTDGLMADENGLVIVHVDPAGGVSRFEYDDAGMLARVTDPDGVEMLFSRIASATDVQITAGQPDGAVASYRTRLVDGGIERVYVAPGGPTTTVLQMPDGQRTASLPGGTRLSIGARPDSRWGLAAPLLTPAVEERPDGVLRRVETEQVVEPTPGDPLVLSAWSWTTTVNGDVYVERYDPARRALTLTDPVGRMTSAVYDGSGRLIAFTAPGEPPAAFAYDDQGRLVTDVRGSGLDVATVAYGYADNGEVTATWQDGTRESWFFDALGRPVQQTAGDGSSVLFSYDAVGRVISVRPGAAQGITLGYTRAGRPTAVVPPPVANDASYELADYDRAGHALSISGPGRRSISMAYDNAGRLSQMTFDRGQLSAQYDPATGQVVSITAPDGVTSHFVYLAGMPTAIVWAGPITGEVRLEVDDRGRAIGESINDGPIVASTYDGAGALTGVGSVAFGVDAQSGLETSASMGVVETTTQFDANGRKTLTIVTANAAQILSTAYRRDAFGRITAVTATSSSSQHTTAYQNDAAGRLAQVMVDGVIVEQDLYDKAGNRVSVKRQDASIEAQYDARNQLRHWAGLEFDYEPDGTLVRRADGGSETLFDFDDLGVMRAVSLPDGTQIEYVVDGSGQRIGRKVDGALAAGYLYRPDGSLVAELDATGAIIARFAYDAEGHLVSIERGGKSFFVVTDHLGSPLLVVDAASGEAVEAIEYDAWGRVMSDTRPGFQPFGFAGGLRDPDTGIIHFGAREYDPTTGRWIEPDPLLTASDDANLYAYVGGDPVNSTDRSGLSPSAPSTTCPLAASSCDGPPTPVMSPEPAPKSGSDECAMSPLCRSVQEKWPPPIGTCVGSSCRPLPTPSPAPMPGSGKGSGRICVGLMKHCFDPNKPPPTLCAMWGDTGRCKPPSRQCWFGHCSSGDPHIRTADRLSLSFQGAGEYLMIQSGDGSVVIQARQAPPFDMTQVTITTAVAAGVAGDRVGVYLDSDSSVLTVRVNGERIDGVDISRMLPHGGSLTRQGTSVDVEWSDGSRLTVDQRAEHLDWGFAPDPAIAATITGLMGTPDGDPSDDLVSRDGSLTLDPSSADFFTQLHGPFGDSWRITQGESLFDYGPGESTASFTRPEIPTGPSTPDAVPPETRASAEALCRAVGAISEPTLSDCIVDVGLTGDPSYAASASAVEAASQAAPPRGAQRAIDIGDTVFGIIAADDQRDAYTFSSAVGQVVFLEALGPCLEGLSWELLGPAGEHIVSGVICNDLGPWTTLAAGTYTIVAHSESGVTGAYAFEFRTAR